MAAYQIRGGRASKTVAGVVDVGTRTEPPSSEAHGGPKVYRSRHSPYASRRHSDSSGHRARSLGCGDSAPPNQVGGDCRTRRGRSDFGGYHSLPHRIGGVMNETYLEVTFRRGRPIAAYYYLPRKRGQKSHRTRRIEPGLVIDMSRDGQPIGIEITAPSK